MANDHYISRFLTRRWEVDPGRRLHFFDFETSTFGSDGSKALFADEGLHSKETGETMCRFVEQPIAQLLRQLEKNPRASLADPEDWRTFRALAALHSLQVQRLLEARGGGGDLAMTLDQFLGDGESAIDAVGHFARERFHMYVVTVPLHEGLFFTEAAYFPIATVGAVFLALPLSPQHFMTLAPHTVEESAISEVLQTPSLISGLSIGIGTNVLRVVLPPAMIPADEAEAETKRQGILLMRSSARRFVELLGRASAIAGLDSWTVP